MQFLIKNLTIILVPLLVFIGGCGTKKKYGNYNKIVGYNLSKPITIHLKTEMDEISGLHFYPKDTSVFAIIDEAGILYKIHIKKTIEITKWQFSNKADYEDLSLIDSTFYALKSNGDITSFKFMSVDSLQRDTYISPYEGTNEFEGMYFDAGKRKLVILCKDCVVDKQKSLTAYSFDPASKTFSADPFFKLDVTVIAEKLGLEEIKFKPSAAAIHPLTKDLFIISSVNKALVIAGADGVVKEAYSIDPSVFKQPEGLTFTPWGDMLISNEAADIGSPNILIFKFKARVNAKG